MKLHGWMLAAALAWSGMAASAGNMDDLRDDLRAYVNKVDATVGVAVMTADGDTLTVNNEVRYPMMSVFKFHQALAVSDYLDRNGLSLDEVVKVTPADLLLNTWSPIKDKYPGGVELSVGDMLGYTLQWSDNLGCNVLFDRFVSPEATEAFIHGLGVDGVEIKHDEEDMYRNHAASYENWSSPYAAVLLLDKFVEGKAVGEPYYSFIRYLMLTCTTGTGRLAAPFKGSDYIVGHKTGSGYVNADGRLMACNDIGFVLSPDGRKQYLIAVFVRDSGLAEKDTEAVIATVSRMVKDALLK